MEARGLITRRRDEVNRRIHVVELTEAGEAAFLRQREAAVGFDRRLRTGISDEEVAAFDALLDRFTSNVGDGFGGQGSRVVGS